MIDDPEEEAWQELEAKLKRANKLAEYRLKLLVQIPEQKPVAWMYVNEDGECEQIEYGVSTVEDPYITLLYTAPPSKPWVGLDDNDFKYHTPQYVLTMKYAEAILRDKNK